MTMTKNPNYPLTHGATGTPEYNSWNTMRNRCLNQNNSHYKHYGGRGITVCDRWLNSFENFFADMGPRPSLQHTLDRKDNDGNYEPDNCRWATKKEQGANTRKARMITFRGETHPLHEWARRVGFNVSSLHYRLARMSVEEAFTQPKHSVRSNDRLITYKGETLTISKWARRVGLNVQTLYARLMTHGWEFERALMTPVNKTKKRRKKP